MLKVGAANSKQRIKVNNSISPRKMSKSSQGRPEVDAGVCVCARAHKRRAPREARARHCLQRLPRCVYVLLSLCVTVSVVGAAHWKLPLARR